MRSIVARPTCCLSFDLEEHFQVPAFDSPMRRRHWERFESRVERNTDKILELLDQAHARATFFVLGWLAERHPAIVQRIAEAGHEIASHGYDNELVTAQTPRQFRDDVRKTKKILEDVISKTVRGYRAPNFTFADETLWALPILVEEGHGYDSSILPSGIKSGVKRISPKGLRQISTPSGPLWEMPPAFIRIAWNNLPISGGACFRLTPYRLFRRTITQPQDGRNPPVLYFRAWELDPKQPRMNGRALARFNHYWNLTKVESRLKLMLRDFRCIPVAEVLPEIAEMNHEPNVTASSIP